LLKLKKNKYSMATKKQADKKTKTKATTTKSSVDKKHKEAIEKLEALVAEEKEKYLRLFAEFENYKKRTAKERIDLFKTAGQEIMTALIPVLDDFDRAAAQWEKNTPSSEVEGFLLIKNKFLSVLQANGLKPTETAAGDPFDAEKQEAISLLPVADEAQKGKIIDIVERGYQMGEKIVRFPKVVVGQ